MVEIAQRQQLRPAGGRITQVVEQSWQWHQGKFFPVDSWSPAINVYQLERRVEVCVDLAGLDTKSVEVRVEINRLIIRGSRPAPEPQRGKEPMRILSMEINHGPFCRIMTLNQLIDLPRVQTQYVNGLLWICLPLRSPG